MTFNVSFPRKRESRLDPRFRGGDMNNKEFPNG